jgi:hypothetical protein
VKESPCLRVHVSSSRFASCSQAESTPAPLSATFPLSGTFGRALRGWQALGVLLAKRTPQAYNHPQDLQSYIPLDESTGLSALQIPRFCYPSRLLPLKRGLLVESRKSIFSRIASSYIMEEFHDRNFKDVHCLSFNLTFSHSLWKRGERRKWRSNSWSNSPSNTNGVTGYCR